MRILVVGAGALGGVIGAQLTEAGEDVTFIEIDPNRVDLLNKEGLRVVQDDKPERTIAIRVVNDLAGMAPVDLVFVSVKSYQTRNAVMGVMQVISDKTWVLSMQNGIGNTDTMAQILGPERVLSGITYHSIQHMGPNALRFRKGVKPIQIAPYQGSLTSDIRNIGEIFNRAGLATEILENIDHVVWQKLLHNAVVNPISALTGKNCNELLDDEHLQLLMRGLCTEIIAVMKARGVPIVDEEDPYRPVVGSQNALGPNRPSMWQDLNRGLMTEIDALNGAVVREAAKLNLSAPMNETIVHLVHSREKQKLNN